MIVHYSLYIVLAEQLCTSVEGASNGAGCMLSTQTFHGMYRYKLVCTTMAL